MTTTEITIERTCPACMGRGASYGPNYCDYCRGRHQVTERIRIDAAPAVPAEVSGQ